MRRKRGKATRGAIACAVMLVLMPALAAVPAWSVPSAAGAASGRAQSSGFDQIRREEQAAREAVIRGDWAQLASSAATWAAADPDNPVPFWLLNHGSEATGKPDALAHVGIRSAASRPPRGAVLLLEASLGFGGSGTPERLVTWAHQLTQQSTGSSVARLLEGDALLLKGNWDEGLSALDECLRLHPDSAYSYCVRGRWLAKAASAKSPLQTFFGDLPDDWEKAFGSSVDHAAVAEGRAKAVADFGRAVELAPDLVVAYLGRAEVYAAQQDYGPAISDYSTAISLRPMDPSLYSLRAATYVKRGDYGSAISDYDQVIRIGQQEWALSFAHLSRADAYRQKGDHDRALADCARAISLRPNGADAYHLRGEIYEEMGDRERALADYDRALALDPSNLIFGEIVRESRNRLLSAPPTPILPPGGLAEERLGTPRAFRWDELGIRPAEADLRADVSTLITSGTPEDNPMSELMDELNTGQNPILAEAAQHVGMGLTGTDEFIMVPGQASDYVHFTAADAAALTRLDESARAIVEVGRMAGVRAAYTVKDASGAIVAFYPIVGTSDLAHGAPPVSVSTLALPTAGPSISIVEHLTTPSALGVAIRGAVRFDSNRWVAFFGGIRCKGGGANLDDAGFTLLPGTVVRYSSADVSE